MGLSVVDNDTGELIGKATINSDSRKNKDFVMMYRKCIEQLADLSLKDPRAMQIFMFLVKNMDNTNALAIPMDLMSKMLGITRQTISSKIKYLQEHGWIEIFKCGKTNVYVLNPDVVWTSYETQKKYCKFKGVFMLDPSENNFDIPANMQSKYKVVSKAEVSAVNEMLRTISESETEETINE